MTMAPPAAGHAPGWGYRKHTAGRLAHPTPDVRTPSVGGLCESGWHTDCAQAPIAGIPSVDQCHCDCHRVAPLALFDL